MSSTDWAAALRERGDAAPAAPRVALWAPSGSARIGSVAPALAQRMALAGLPLHPAEDGWQLGEPLDESLERTARWLSANLLDGRWRGELLAVTDDDGTVVGAIERTAVRPLGIATYAVHLVGHTVEGEVWVQQRALDKASDPGRWDTLVGGLVSAGENVLQTLERETWEEAGLRIDALADVHAFGRLTVRRPLAEGHMVEHMHCFEATVPAGVRPVNQDGEVLRFEALPLAALRPRLEADAFTVEASLALLGWLERRGPALQPSPASI